LLLSQQELNTVPETDDDELSVLGPLLDVVCHNRHVLEVQGCVYLVHHVQRRRLQKNHGNLLVLSSIHLSNTHKSDIELDALDLPPVFQKRLQCFDFPGIGSGMKSDYDDK